MRPTLTEPRPLRGCRVLVVDDKDGPRALYSLTLSRAGAEVIPVAAGQHAVDAVAEFRRRGRLVDAALLDYDMPGMRGPEVARSLRASGHRGAVVGYSCASPLPEIADEFLAAGADAVADEPHDAGSVLSLVVAVCGRRWAMGDEG